MCNASRFSDVFWKGSADDGAWQLAELLNLKDELSQMVAFGHKKIDEKINASKSTLVEGVKESEEKEEL